jgi:hypothetical protein
MSSTIDYTQFSVAQLIANRAAIDDIIMSLSAGVAPAAAGKSKAKAKDGKEKVKRKGSPGAWSDWTKKVMIDCDAEIKAFKEAAEQKGGAHLKWISANKGKTSPEWLEFKAEWDASHPKAAKGAKASDAEEADEAEEAEDDSPAAAQGGGGSVAAVAAVAAPVAEKVAKRRGPKKLTDMTPEERAAHDAKVAERKATKNAGATALELAAKAAVPVPTAALVAEPKLVAAPVAAPKPAPVAEEAAEEAEEEDSVELKIFVVDGQKYMRPWSNSAKEWATNDLWYTNKKGEKAAYWGELMEDGSVNADAEEPQFE